MLATLTGSFRLILVVLATLKGSSRLILVVLATLMGSSRLKLHSLNLIIPIEISDVTFFRSEILIIMYSF